LRRIQRSEQAIREIARCRHIRVAHRRHDLVVTHEVRLHGEAIDLPDALRFAFAMVLVFATVLPTEPRG